MIKNLMEEEVSMVIDEILTTMDNMCKCEKCKDDIAAIALNNLKPSYVASKEGYLYSKANHMDCQFNTDVVTAVIKSIEIVSKNPKHDK